MHRREDEVARHRGLHRDIRGLHIADLADEDDIGVLAKDRAEETAEGVPLLRVDRDLRRAVDLVLDRILDRDRIALLEVDLAKTGVERSRLARARRAAGEHEPCVAVADRAELLEHPRQHAELVQTARRVGRVEDAEHELHAMDRRRQADAVVDAARLDLDIEVAVEHLRLHALIELAEDAHDADNLAEDVDREILDQGHHHPVDADSNVRLVGLRLHVEVARTRAEAREEEQPHDLDAFRGRVAVFGGSGMKGVAAGVDERDVRLAELLRQRRIADPADRSLIPGGGSRGAIDGGSASRTRSGRSGCGLGDRLWRHETNLEVADPHHIAGTHAGGRDFDPIELGPVPRTEVGHPPPVLAAFKHAVLAAEAVIIELNLVIRMSPDRDRVAAEVDSAGPTRAVDLKERHRRSVTYEESECSTVLTLRKGGMLLC